MIERFIALRNPVRLRQGPVAHGLLRATGAGCWPTERLAEALPPYDNSTTLNLAHRPQPNRNMLPYLGVQEICRE